MNLEKRVGGSLPLPAPFIRREKQDFIGHTLLDLIPPCTEDLRKT
jgi:hypothetical protein